MKEGQQSGYLYKYTNVVKGFQKRWFVLKDSRLIYYKSADDVEKNCRGYINLNGANVSLLHAVNLRIYLQNKGTLYLKASKPEDAARWLTAIELASTNCSSEVQNCQKNDQTSYATGNFDTYSLISTNISGLRDSNDLLTQLIMKCDQISSLESLLSRHCTALLKATKNSSEDSEKTSSLKDSLEDSCELVQKTCNSISKTCKEIPAILHMYHERVSMQLNTEMQKNSSLMMNLHTLGYQYHALEQKALTVSRKSMQDMSESAIEGELSSEMSDEFFDALSENPDIEFPTKYDTFDTGHQTDLNSRRSNFNHKKYSSDIVGKKLLSRKTFRTRIPDRPPVKLSLWSFIKNAIGKDLSKIPMPVNFNEPLSMLQRVTECLQYSSLIDKASKSEDTLMQLAYITAFAVSCYSETAQRVNKPFNPLLNETFEFDRSTDLGWRSICEQVSHHPPVCALHAESKMWEFSETFSVVSKFRGKYLLVEPLGIAELRLKDGNRYSWNKVETTVNNIIIGSLSIEQSGTMEVINHVTKEKCVVKFHSSSIFSNKSKRRITGTLYDTDGNSRFVVEGFWDKFVEFLKITAVTGKDSYETGIPTRLWSISPLKEEAAKYYNFTDFTCSLNQEQDNIAPTDSRNRPDQRFLEQGVFEKADELKVKLEEKQRARRKTAFNEELVKNSDLKNEHGEVIKSVWFEVDENNDLQCGAPIYKYKGGYWESKLKCEWDACPSLFDI